MAAQNNDDIVARQDEPQEQRDAALDAAANLRGESEMDRDGWAALPIAGYSPETHLGLGGFGIYFFRLPGEPTETRPSSIAGILYGTTREQAIVEVMPELYFDDERWHFWNKFDFRRFPDSYWGIGNDVPDSAERRYDQTSWRYRTLLRRLVAASFYVGFIADAQHVSVDGIEVAPGGGLDNVPGAEGGRTIGAGGTLNWDTRDNAVDAREGGFYQLRVMTWQPWTLSEYEFTRLSLDLRHFFPLDGWGAGGHSIGVQLYTELNAGDVPFHQMARIGGEFLMRGYFEGRYRDKDMLAGQVEYRFPIWWRFRGVAFAAAGDVSADVTSFDFGGLEVSGGTGLRFSLNEQERLNIRADFGFGIDTWGAYIGISEAF